MTAVLVLLVALAAGPLVALEVWDALWAKRLAVLVDWRAAGIV
jgi:hypothetical protein